MEIHNLLSKLREIVNRDQVGIYDIEAEIIEIGKLNTKFFIDRYSSEKWRHWLGERSVFVGLVGQKVFDVVLQQFSILSDYNDPTIDWRTKKPYDFRTNLGTIETKCFDCYAEKVLVKAIDWHGNDYLVALKFVDEKPKVVKLMGWLTKDQVEAQPITEKGKTKYTKFAAARIIDFDMLNPFPQLIEKLKTADKT